MFLVVVRFVVFLSFVLPCFVVFFAAVLLAVFFCRSLVAIYLLAAAFCHFNHLNTFEHLFDYASTLALLPAALPFVVASSMLGGGWHMYFRAFVLSSLAVLVLSPLLLASCCHFPSSLLARPNLFAPCNANELIRFAVYRFARSKVWNLWY